MPIPDYTISQVVLHDLDGNPVPVTTTEPSHDELGLVVRVVGQVSTGGAADGHVTWNTVAGVVPLATEQVVSVTAPQGYRFTGFTATGTGDGYFLVEASGATIMSGRIHATQQNVERTLRTGVAVPAGDVVRITVRNDSTALAQYEATIMGETL